MYSLLRYSQFSNSMIRMATPILDYAHPKKFRLTFNFYELVSGYFMNLFWRNRTFMIARIKKKRPNLSKCLKNPASDSFWRNLFFFRKNSALSRTSSYGFLTLCQNLEKTNDPLPRCPDITDGTADTPYFACLINEAELKFCHRR